MENARRQADGPRTGKATPDAPHASTAEQIDLSVAEAIEPVARHPLTRLVALIGKVGDEPPVMTLSIATLGYGILTRRPRLMAAGARMIAAHGAAIALKTIGKNRVDRTRPNEAMRTGEYRMEPGTSSDSALRSFPSGHSAGVVAVACAAAREYPARALPLYAGAALVAGLQVPRRAHFLTDVLAGAATGVLAERLTRGLWWAAKRALSARR